MAIFLLSKKSNDTFSTKKCRYHKNSKSFCDKVNEKFIY